MKLRYFVYYLRKFDNQNKFLFNIKPLIDAFIDSNNMKLKSSFKRGNDKLYLTQVKGEEQLYYFVRTSDDDLIKRINEKSLTVSDIADEFSANDKMAYVSYVYLSSTDSTMACASSTSCPRFDDFCDYINELFSKIDLKNYEFNISALTSNNNKKDLMKMEMVNSVYVDVSADKSLGKLIAKELTGDSTASLGNFRITVEPTGINLKKPFEAMLNRLAPSGKIKNSQGVTQIGAKAKHNELKGQLIDYWLDNENNLIDSLNPKAKTKLPAQITAKYDENVHIDTLYKEYKINNSLKINNDALLSKYTDKSQFSSKEQTSIKPALSANDKVVIIMKTEVSH